MAQIGTGSILWDLYLWRRKKCEPRRGSADDIIIEVNEGACILATVMKRWLFFSKHHSSKMLSPCFSSSWPPCTCYIVTCLQMKFSLSCSDITCFTDYIGSTDWQLSILSHATTTSWEVRQAENMWQETSLPPTVQTAAHSAKLRWGEPQESNQHYSLISKNFWIFPLETSWDVCNMIDNLPVISTSIECSAAGTLTWSVSPTDAKSGHRLPQTWNSTSPNSH